MGFCIDPPSYCQAGGQWWIHNQQVRILATQLFNVDDRLPEFEPRTCGLWIHHYPPARFGFIVSSWVVVCRLSFVVCRLSFVFCRLSFVVCRTMVVRLRIPNLLWARSRANNTKLSEACNAYQQRCTLGSSAN